MTSKEALKRIETTFSLNREGKDSVYRAYTNSIYPYYEDFDLVMRDLEALEIIKKRQIAVKDIINTIDNIDDFELYQACCIGYGYADEDICDKEEFDLLKQVLNNDK